MDKDQASRLVAWFPPHLISDFFLKILEELANIMAFGDGKLAMRSRSRGVVQLNNGHTIITILVGGPQILRTGPMPDSLHFIVDFTHASMEQRAVQQLERESPGQFTMLVLKSRGKHSYPANHKLLKQALLVTVFALWFDGFENDDFIHDIPRASQRQTSAKPS